MIKFYPAGSSVWMDIMRDDKLGSIKLPDSYLGEHSIGVVVAVGPGDWRDGGLVPVPYSIGDRLVYISGSGIEVQGKVMARTESILGRLEE